MIPLKALMQYIPKPIRSNIDDDGRIEQLLLQALKQVTSNNIYERIIDIIEVINHKASLPEDLKKINKVTYSESDCTKEDEIDLCCQINETPEIIDQCGDTYEPPICNGLYREPSEKTRIVCKYPIYFKIWYESNLYVNNFRPMKYIGKVSSKLDNCLMEDVYCDNTYSLDNDTITTSFKNGFLSLDYMRFVKNENGDILIDDLPQLINYLVTWVKLTYYEEMISDDINGYKYLSMYKQSKLELDIYFAKLRGYSMLKEIKFSKLYNLKNRNTVLMKGGQYIINGK